MTKYVDRGGLAEFESVFPDEIMLEPIEYLKGGSKGLILKAAALFLGFNNWKSKYDDNRVLFADFFNSENAKFAQAIYDNIKRLEAPGKAIKIINPYSSLTLFELYFNQEEQIVTQTDLEFERNLFKAYFVLNSKYTDAQAKAFQSTRDLPITLKLAMMYFCLDYPTSDKQNYNLGNEYISQIFKAVWAFQYFESNKKFQPLIQAFLKKFHVASWQVYLITVLGLVSHALKNQHEAHTEITILQEDKTDEFIAFINNIALDGIEELQNYDFLTLRSKPFYKIGENKYGIIFNLFAIDKIYKGLYFLLNDVNESLAKHEKIRNLKSDFGFLISEKVLLYNIIEEIYLDKCIKYSGAELDAKRIDGAIDYYIRRGKNILLIESKDFLMKAEKKMSFDYEMYANEFEEKLYYSINEKGKEEDKAILQLINNVKRVLKKENSFDTDYNYREVSIYPILLTHDTQYDVVGFNYLLNTWFQEELNLLRNEGLFVNRVKPLMVVNIDTLIYYQVHFKVDISLHVALDEYLKVVNINPNLKFENTEVAEQYYLNKFIPFSFFFEKYAQEKNYKKIPPIMELVAPALFRDE